MGISGCFLAVLTLQRANENFHGCHNIAVAIWLLFLTTTLVFVCWNAYNMIYDDLGNNTTVYRDMVYGICVWNIVLMLISCNIMIRNDDDGLKRGSTKANYRTVDEEAWDHSNQSDDFHQL